MKLHVGSNRVYLAGYINIDLECPQVKLAATAPELVGAYYTTEDNYYGRHGDVSMDTVTSGPNREFGVCDMYGSLQDLPVPDHSASEVLCRQVFEHLSITEARAGLKECRRVIAPGGHLRLDVPDHDKSMELYRETGKAFFKRHVLGSRKDDYAYHVMAYTRSGLMALCRDWGFTFEDEEENIHFYPAFCLRFRRD